MKIRSLVHHTLLTSAMCVALAVPSLAQAFYLVGDGYQNGSESMTLTATPSPIINPVGAGGFFGRISPNSNMIPSTPLLFWCAELTQTFSFGTVNPNYSASILSNTNLSKLFTEVGGSAGATGGANSGNDDGTDLSAAFQIAIWEILFETNSGAYNVSGGTFQASGDADVVTKAQALLDGLAAVTNPTYVIFLLHSDNNQDFITDTPIPPSLLVPEPSPLPLLGAGLIALYLAMRKRRSN